jgi:hypothetical protein
MSVTLRSINSTPNSDTLNVLDEKGFLTVSPGASVANTTVQTAIILPYNFKIRLVAVMYSTCDSVAGTDGFNIVVGGLIGQTGQAYTAGNIQPNDNSDTYGYPYTGTSPTGAAVVGIAPLATPVFGADVPINSANLQSTNTQGVSGDLTGRALPNTGWLTCTTTGGYGLFVPTNYDAVYPAATPISLRAFTTTGTGTIGNLCVTIGWVPVRRRAATTGSPSIAQTLPYPATDY